jgi:4-hydroxy-2-oxoheptanedioate aldolase
MSALFSLPDRLRSGTPLIGAWCTVPQPLIADTIAREPNFGAVCVDLQHGGFDFASAAEAIQLVALAGKPAGVRIPVGDFSLASRLLDAGASLVIAPMINTAADAKALAQCVKYAPVGARSWGPTQAVKLAGVTPGDYLAAANAGTVAFAMVETRQALDNIDDILAVAGVDGVFIGPSDLSITLTGGKLAPQSAEVDEAVRHALSRARAAKKFAGIFAASGERARDFVQLGYDYISVGTDMLMLKAGAAQMHRVSVG